MGEGDIGVERDKVLDLRREGQYGQGEDHADNEALDKVLFHVPMVKRGLRPGTDMMFGTMIHVILIIARIT